MKPGTNQQDEVLRQLHKLQYDQSVTLGRVAFSNLIIALSSRLPAELKNHRKQWVLVTAAPENTIGGQDLSALFFLASSASNGALVPLGPAQLRSGFGCAKVCRRGMPWNHDPREYGRAVGHGRLLQPDLSQGGDER